MACEKRGPKHPALKRGQAGWALLGRGSRAPRARGAHGRRPRGQPAAPATFTSPQSQQMESELGTRAFNPLGGGALAVVLRAVRPAQS